MFEDVPFSNVIAMRAMKISLPWHENDLEVFPMLMMCFYHELYYYHRILSQFVLVQRTEIDQQLNIRKK